MNRASAEWFGPLLLMFALRAVVPSALDSDLGSTVSASSAQASGDDSKQDDRGVGDAAASPTTCGQKLDQLLDGSCRPAPPDPCVEALMRLQAQSHTSLGGTAPALGGGASYRLPLDQTLLIMVPDPLDTSAVAAFDSSLETIVEAFADREYVRDRFVLPQPKKPDKDNDKKPAPKRCPGMLLFRNIQPGPERKDIAVLVVGESSAWGHDTEALDAALGLIDVPDACGAQASERRELRIAGPYYSGATPGLIATLDAFSQEHCVAYRIGSGSVSAPKSLNVLNALNADPTRHAAFRSFTRSIADRQQEIETFIDLQDGDGLAVLQESGTVYGQGSKLEKHKNTFEIAYPPNVSALRSAYSLLQQAAETNRKSTAGRVLLDRLPMTAEHPGVPNDTLPPFAAGTTIVTHDLALQRVVTTLHEQRVGDAIVSGVLPEDVVFLSQRLKSGIPDLRVSTYQMDSLFLHGDCARDLRGSLVVSAYAPVDSFENAEDRILRPTLARDAASGLFHTVRWLLEPKSESDKPHLSLGVLSHGRFWPLKMESPPRHGSIPGVFALATVAFIALAVFNTSVILGATRSDEPAPAEPAADAKASLSARVDRIRKRLWVLSGLYPCKDPVIACWHSVMVCISQCALLAALLVLSQVWWMICSFEAAPSAKLVLVLVAVMSLACIYTLRKSIQGVRASRSMDSVTSTELLPAVRTWSLGSLLLIAGPMLAIGGLAVFGLQQTPASDRAMLMLRTLQFGSGASPLSVILLACIFVYHFGLAHASRLRMIDFGDLRAGEKNDDSALSRRFVISRATYHGDDLQVREQALFESAILPGGVRWFVAAIAAILAPIFACIYVRRSVFVQLHGFTLETRPLSIAMALALLLCFGIAVVTTLQVLRLWRSLDELLHGLASSDLLEAFKHVEKPIDRPVAEQLALGRQDDAELDLVLRGLGGPSLPLEKDHDSTPLPQTDKFGALLRAAAKRRAEIDELGLSGALEATHTAHAASKATHDAARVSREAISIPPPEGAKAEVVKAEREAAKANLDAAKAELEAAKTETEAAQREIDAVKAALATHVAFGLPRWIKQFRFLLWLVTTGTAVLLLSSTSYVFTVRRLLATTFSFFTLAAVIAGATVFMGLERDEVLSRIGGTPAGKVALQNNLLRIAGWGILPISLAFATYYPDAVRSMLTWFDTLGGAP